MPIVHCIRWREADADAKFARRIFGDGDECLRTRQRHLAHFILSSFPRDHAREKSHHPTERVLPRPANIVIGRGCTGVVDRSGSCPARDRHEVIRDRARYRAPRATIPRRRGALKRFKVRQAGQRMHDERSVFRSGVRKSGPIHTAQTSMTTYGLARSDWRSNRLPRCTAESSAACADFLLPT